MVVDVGIAVVAVHAQDVAGDRYKQAAIA